MDRLEVKLECLKLAVQTVLDESPNSPNRVVRAAAMFYEFVLMPASGLVHTEYNERTGHEELPN